ncbi:hypothetical protein ACWIEX_23255 [Bosea sp. NPDC055353]
MSVELLRHTLDDQSRGDIRRAAGRVTIGQDRGSDRKRAPEGLRRGETGGGKPDDAFAAIHSILLPNFSQASSPFIILFE